MAAGTLMITEAGGLVGNFTGESDFLYQRELVCGSPKIYGQLVTLLAPFTRVIKDDAHAAVPEHVDDPEQMLNLFLGQRGVHGQPRGYV